MGSDESHFNVLLTQLSQAKSQDSDHKTKKIMRKEKGRRIKLKSFCLPA